jgi:signal transduction histidine kinase
MGLPGPSVSLLKESIQKAFETAQPMEVEHFIPIKNGTRFYQSHCVPEFGVDGTVVNALVVSSDITERKRAEEVLRQRSLELQRLTETPEHRVQERTAELARANEVLRQLSIRLLSAQEKETRRIAGEIHDILGSCLSAIKFKMEGFLQGIGGIRRNDLPC